MKIALFSEVFLPKIDGITNRLRHTLNELARTGHEVRIFAPSNAVDQFAGFPVERIPGLAFRPYKGLHLSYPHFRIYKALKDFQPDVVHLVGPACLGVWGMFASRWLQLPVVASYHTDLPKYAPLYGLRLPKSQIWSMIRSVHNRATLNLCPSQHTLRELKSHGIQQLGLWRGGVDTQIFHPDKKSSAMRARLSGGLSSAPLITYVGRLGFEKGLNDFKILIDNFPKARFALVGDGPARAGLERSLASDRVRFTGFLNGTELAEAYASSDVFFMPSTTETLGFVTLEAMSSACAVLAARAGGTLDLIQSEHNGLLYDPGDTAAMIEGCRTLLEQAPIRQALASRARASAESSSWSQETKALLENYRVAVRRHTVKAGLLSRLPASVGSA